MLNQVQHDMTVRLRSFCHPEPGPELDSGSIDFSISVLGFRIKAPPCGRGSLPLPGIGDLLTSRIFSYRLPEPKSPEFGFAILVRV